MGIRWRTAGESHGPALIGVLEGIPRGLSVDFAFLASELARRRHGYGRSGRQRVEDDAFALEGGVRHGLTTGAPIAVRIVNRDHEAWGGAMSARETDEPVARFTKPRPGHADLAGGMKYRTHDLRDVVERSSARETAMRVALGAIAKMVLRASSDTRVVGCVTRIHDVVAKVVNPLDEALAALLDVDDNRCGDAVASARMSHAIKAASQAGSTVGGVFEVHAGPMLAGLGSYAQWDMRLDARLGGAMMSIPGIKGVEIGEGFGYAVATGAEVHDAIAYEDGRFARSTNRAGGMEGGVSTGEPVVVRAVMKPIPTQRRPLPSVDVETHEACDAAFERSDVCAVAPACVVAEAMVALTLADAMLDKVGGDTMDEVRERVVLHRQALGRY